MPNSWNVAGACLCDDDDFHDFVGSRVDDDDAVVDDEVAIASVCRDGHDDVLGNGVKLHAARHSNADVDREVDVDRLPLVLGEGALHLGALFLRQGNGAGPALTILTGSVFRRLLTFVLVSR